MQPHLKKLAPVALFAILGIGISVWIEVLHSRLSADIGYTSFCNVNSVVNCDVVLTSRYAALAGQPVSRWSILYYTVVLAGAIAIAYESRARTREGLGRILLILSALGFLFSVYMAFVAFVILQTVCLMCSGLYLISIGLVVSTWQLRSSLRILGPRQKGAVATSDRSIVLGGIAIASFLLLGIAYEFVAPQGFATSSEQVRTERPEFYAWFFAQPVVPISAESNLARGKPGAAVTIVEFSDFQCGHCAKLHESLEQVLRRQGANMRVLFRHFPLDSSCNTKLTQRFHPDACLAAIAAECAGEQGRFWEYHSILFEHQNQLGREFLNRYAADVGLNTTQFSACLGSDAARLRVQHDIEEGQRVDIESTPTLFINGRRIKGSLDPDRLSDAVILAIGK